MKMNKMKTLICCGAAAFLLGLGGQHRLQILRTIAEGNAESDGYGRSSGQFLQE